jgi:hypothetical protein
MRYKLLLMLWLGLLAVGAAHASSNLISNGSFEEDLTFGSNGFATYSTYYGWNVGSNGIELRNNVAGTAEDGETFAELDTTANSWISQTVSTVVGQEYVLTFYYAARAGVAADSNGINVNVYGSTIGSTTSGDLYSVVYSATYNYTADGSSATELNWTQKTIDFVAVSTTTTLTFSAGGISDSVGGALDNVVLLAVPEPSQWALLLAGLGMMGFIARRRA